MIAEIVSSQQTFMALCTLAPSQTPFICTQCLHCHDTKLDSGNHLFNVGKFQSYVTSVPTEMGVRTFKCIELQRFGTSRALVVHLLCVNSVGRTNCHNLVNTDNRDRTQMQMKAGRQNQVSSYWQADRQASR